MSAVKMLLGFVVLAAAMADPPVVDLHMEHGVAVIKPEQFMDVVASRDALLIMFYAPVCLPCLNRLS
jgi:hypothetical protein